MLVLSRKAGETILVGDVVIKVCEIRPGCRKVRIGIEAPADVEIVRGEFAGEWVRRPLVTKQGPGPAQPG